MIKKRMISGFTVLAGILGLVLTVNANSDMAYYTVENYHTTDTYQYATASYQFDLPQLIGDGTVINEINASLDSEYQDSQEGKIRLLESAENAGETYNGAEFFYNTKCTEATNKNGILSFQFTTDWFAGGVHNSRSYGATYNLKTGEKLGLSDLLAGSADEIDEKIVNAYCEKIQYPDYWELLDVIRENRQSNLLCYYLKGEEVIVSCGDYGPLGGNGEIAVSVKARDEIINGTYVSNNSENFIPIQQVAASSVREPEPDYSYEVRNIIDGDPTTTWTEGVDGYGENEFVTLYFSKTNVKGLVIYPGYCGSKYQYDINAHPTGINISVNNEPGVYYPIEGNEESRGPVYVYFHEALYTDNLKITIASVGTTEQTKYEDTCISEIKLIQG